MNIEEMEILFLNARIAGIQKDGFDVVGNDGVLYRFHCVDDLSIGKVKEVSE